MEEFSAWLRDQRKTLSCYLMVTRSAELSTWLRHAYWISITLILVILWLLCQWNYHPVYFMVAGSADLSPWLLYGYWVRGTSTLRVRFCRGSGLSATQSTSRAIATGRTNCRHLLPRFYVFSQTSNLSPWRCCCQDKRR